MTLRERTRRGLHPRAAWIAWIAWAAIGVALPPAAAEEASALSEFIPPAVILMLVVIAVIASAMMAVRLAARDQRSSLAAMLLAGMLALILGTVIDLDQPQRGFIRVSLEPLRVVQRGL